MLINYGMLLFVRDVPTILLRHDDITLAFEVVETVVYNNESRKTNNKDMAQIASDIN